MERIIITFNNELKNLPDSIITGELRHNLILLEEHDKIALVNPDPAIKKKMTDSMTNR
jgi:hypothetical protein